MSSDSYMYKLWAMCIFSSKFKSVFNSSSNFYQTEHLPHWGKLASGRNEMIKNEIEMELNEMIWNEEHKITTWEKKLE